MKILGPIKHSILFGLLIGWMGLNSCSGSGDESMDIGSQFVNSNTYAEMIDSVSLNFSTTHIDSIVTSSTGIGLVGNYNQKKLGTVSTSSFMSLLYNGGVPDKKEIYDSLTMVLKYSGYYLGDTMKAYTLNVYRVTDSITWHNTNESQAFYNKHSFNHESTPIGTCTFYPKPTSGDTVRIHFTKAFGDEMWSFIKQLKVTSDQSANNIKLFEQNFRGLVLKSENDAVLGFSIDDTLGYLNIHSHIISSETEDLTRVVTLKGASYQFNNIELAPENQALNKENFNDKTILSETVTDNMAFMQAGTAYRARIDIPNIDRLMELREVGRIIRAVLIVRPAEGTYDINDLPKTLYIAQVDKVNQIESYLTDASESKLTGNLTIDPYTNENTYYSYDITSYLTTILNYYVTDPGKGLMLTLGDKDNQSVDALVLNGFKNKECKSYLKIFYYYYDKDQQ